MIYNENITNQYGTFLELSVASSPKPFRPKPTPTDYSNGYITRVFVKKANENVVIEIQAEQVDDINSALYKVVYVNWKISGPRETVYSGRIVDSYGVTQQNQFEIEKIRTEQDVDLRHALPNPLEFWRGH